MKPLSFFVSLFVCLALFSLPCLAQRRPPLETPKLRKPLCTVCKGTGQIVCDFHGDAWDPIRGLSFYSEWAAEEFTCCALLGRKDCAECERPSEIQEIRARHEAWRNKPWGSSSRKTSSVPILSDLIDTLASEDKLYVASSKHFFVVSDHKEKELRRAQLRALLPELQALSKRFPHIVDTDNVLSPQEAMVLYLQRCEEVYERFLKMIAVEEGAFQPVIPGIEVFFFSPKGRSQHLFEFLHDGASRVYGGPERFVVWEQDNSAFGDRANPEDTHGRAVLNHRGGAALLAQYMWADGKFLHTKNMPQFLELGFGHFMEIEATGKAVFTSHGSEIRDLKSIETPERWQREAFQWVRKGGAPTVGQLTRLPATGTDTEFVHRVSSWSLLSYLYGLYGPEKLGSFLNSMREGYDVPGAIAETFQKTEAQLNYAWHLWVRSTRGRERQPQPGKGPTLEDVDAILEHFEQHWRGREKQDSDDITAAIETLVYLPPEIAAPLLFDVIQRGSDVHASRAVEVLRRNPSAELASLLAEEIDSAGRADEQYLRHLVRCAGAFGSSSDLLFEQLTELRNAPSCPDLVRAAIARTFGELGDERAIPALLEDTDNIHHVIRAEAASALARVSPAEGKEKALKLLGDDSWHVRIAAVDIFGELREWDTVPALIGQLGKEAGRLREDILETLEELIGDGSSAPLESDDPRAWTVWWERIGSTQTGPVEAGVRRSTAQRTVSPRPSQLLPPIYSKKFLMLVDVSASMQQHIWTSSDHSSKRKSQPKIDFVRDGLKLVIDEELSEDKEDLTSFNLWVFAPKVDRWKRKISTSTARNKKNAKRWLDGLEFEDAHATDLHAVLERVMDAADDELEDKARESFVDTLYLITDGMPTVGVTDTESLLAWTRDRNRMHRIRFNIVTIGATDTDLDFLDKLARENDGFLTNVGLH